MGNVVATPDIERLDFDVEGMTCAACVTRLEKALYRVAGGARCHRKSRP